MGGVNDIEVSAQRDESLPDQKRRFADALRDLEGALRAYLRRRVAHADGVDDAAQETYLRMLRYRTLAEPTEIRALLFKVAGSVIADRYRHARCHPDESHEVLEGLDLPSAEPDLDRVVAGREELAAVKAAIAGLSPRCREVFVLSRFEGLSYEQIAQRFGTSVRTIENQISHALAVCRAALGVRSR